MKKKATATTKEAAPVPATTTPAVRAYETYSDVLNITKEEIAKLNKDEHFKIVESIAGLITKAEKAGLSATSKDLKERMYYICETYLESSIVGGTKDLRRQDWENNHSRIQAAIYNYVVNNNSIPTATNLADNTGLSRQTIHEHLKEGVANEFYQERLQAWQSLTDNIFKILYRQAINGSVQASKVLLDNIQRSTQPAPVNNIRQQNNFIQINNTKIDEVTIEALPASARSAIEQIIKQNTIKATI